MTNLREDMFIFLATLFTLSTIVLSAILDGQSYKPIRYLAPAVGVISLCLFAWPILTLRRHGHADPGASYMAAANVVDRRLYGIVRHPQYLGYMGLNITFMLISQQWLVLFLGSVAIALFYLQSLQEEKGLVERFGSDYQAYMQRVPGFNFVLSITGAVGQRWGKDRYGHEKDET